MMLTVVNRHVIANNLETQHATYVETRHYAYDCLTHDDDAHPCRYVMSYPLLCGATIQISPCDATRLCNKHTPPTTWHHRIGHCPAHISVNGGVAAHGNHMIVAFRFARPTHDSTERCLFCFCCGRRWNDSQPHADHAASRQTLPAGYAHGPTKTAAIHRMAKLGPHCLHPLVWLCDPGTMTKPRQLLNNLLTNTCVNCNVRVPQCL